MPDGGLANSLKARQQIIRGDCLKVMATLDDACVDVVITSPPYNLDISYGTYQDRRNEADYLDWLVKVCTQVRRLMRSNASFFLNIAGSSKHPWIPLEVGVRMRSLFELQNHICWVKSITTPDGSRGHFKPVGGKRFLHRQHEHLFHLTLGGNVQLDRLSIGVPFQDKSNIARRGHAGDVRCRGNTWFVPYETVQSKAQKHDHPAGFPVALPQWCIRLHGKPGAVVLDPFLGAGTTLVAAQREGAQGIGIEMDPAYVAMARSRLEQG